MRLIAAALVLLTVPLGAQAGITSRDAAPTGRLPGIAEPSPGTTRLPGLIRIRAAEADPFVERELREARRDVERRRDNGGLTRREARRLRREARLVARLAYRYGSDGLTDGERRELELRATELSARSGSPRPRQASLRR